MARVNIASNQRLGDFRGTKDIREEPSTGGLTRDRGRRHTFEERGRESHCGSWAKDTRADLLRESALGNVVWGETILQPERGRTGLICRCGSPPSRTRG